VILNLNRMAGQKEGQGCLALAAGWAVQASGWSDRGGGDPTALGRRGVADKVIGAHRISLQRGTL
jgi:hypothetical protein